MTACPLCERAATPPLIAENAVAVAFPDAFPLNPGHCLIVPRRHVDDLFALAEDERASAWELIVPVKRALDAAYRPDGYNIGVNVGAAAGQTIFHVHVHVIPRYVGDVGDARGGIRHIIPDRARYWERR